MNKLLSRREFLKSLALLPPSIYLSKYVQGPASPWLDDGSRKNVIIIVFDALSAQNLSLHGYPRETMPNLARIAQKSTVYHEHYAAGNFTTPGTASLLTGTYPWTHRALKLGGSVEEGKKRRNIFNLFDQYYRIVYSHNNFVNTHFRRFRQDIDHLKPQKDLFVKNELAFDRLFFWENDLASLTWERAMKKGEKGYTYSIFFSEIYQEYSQGKVDRLARQFPRGITRIGEDDYFLLEDAINWLKSELGRIEQPFLGYFHFLPPHRPYSPRRDFVNAFKDDGVGYLINKPKHPFFSQGGEGQPISLDFQARQRQIYDEFVLYADSELGRLYDFLEESGLSRNTWLVFTSDHGEMFERGIFGHRTPVLYQPVIRIPLLIREPGQQERRDVYAATSALDVVPTLLNVTGQEIPDWIEGTVMPPYSEAIPDRSIFAVEAKFSPDRAPLSPATITLVKGRHKLTYFLGYEELGEAKTFSELFDLEQDPEELNDLYETEPEVAFQLQAELLERLREADQPYATK